MTLGRLQDFAAAHEWRVAKTMPQYPHAYLHRANARDDDEYIEVIEFIRTHGYDAMWQGTMFRYLDFDGMCYWTCGFTLDAEDILNRAAKEGVEIPFLRNPVLFESRYWPEVWDREAKCQIPGAATRRRVAILETIDLEPEQLHEYAQQGTAEYGNRHTRSILG